jgi:hypothetical protein
MTAGAPKLSARKVLVSNIEASYGVDNASSGNGILASNFTFAPMAATVTKRQRAYENFGSDPSLIAQKHATIGFDCEVAGSGAAGTAPLYGPLLRSCGLMETVVADSDVTYTPISSNFESTAHHFFYDSLEQALTGTRGTCSLKISGGALPMFTFSLTGLWAAATDSAPPDVHADLEAWINAGEVNVTNTDFSLFGIDVVLDTLTIDIGNTVIFRDRPNAAYIAITDRAMTGSASFEATDVSVEDWQTMAATMTTGALALEQNTSGGAVTIAAPNVQLGNPTYTDTNGILHVTVPLVFCRTNGNDEITITVE